MESKDLSKIAQRAYELYLARGGEPGHAEEDWLQAERELGAASTEVVGAAPAANVSSSSDASAPDPEKARGGPAGKSAPRDPAIAPFIEDKREGNSSARTQNGRRARNA